MSRSLRWAIRLVTSLWVCVLCVQPSIVHARDGKFRAIVAIATRYSNQLLPQPSLVKSLPSLDKALRTYAREAGYESMQIDIKYFIDVDGAFTKDGGATDNEIKSAVWNAAADAVRPEDTLIFFFSGHGESNGKTSILYTSGADGRRPISRIILDSEIISESWRRSQAGVKLIVLDACQTPIAGALSSTPALLPPGALAKLVEAVEPPRPQSQGTAILLAADEGQSAWVDDTLGYGFFTHRFTEALQSAQYTTVEQLFSAIGKKVTNEVQARYPHKPIQEPRFALTASHGDYKLFWNSSQTIVGVPLTAPAIRAQTSDEPSPPSMTRLRASAATIYDPSSGLLWTRDLTLLGSTQQIFSKATEGTMSMKGSFLELQEKVQQLSIEGISGWRIAEWPELQSLKSAGNGSLFFAFNRSKSRFRDLIGLYQTQNNEFNLWGYQYQNTLVGPIDWGAGDPSLNKFGIWIVTGPTSLPPANTEAIPEIQEPHVEQVLTPVVSGLLTSTNGQVTMVRLQGAALGGAGRLPDEQQSVFEYALKPLAGNSFVRAEVVLEGAMASGIDPTVEISTYKGDGLLQPSLFSATLEANSQDHTKWFFASRSRLEIPSHLVRNHFYGGDLIGLRARYVGQSGSVHFIIPKLIITYVPQNAALSRRKEFAAREKESFK